MAVIVNLRNQSILPTFYLVFALLLWTCPSYAAKLVDIRVGEHETYTRIVFEHSDTIPHETLRPLSSGRLSVVFPNTEIDLSRKIPIERSNRLTGIEIWQRKHALSLVLTFAFEHFRYELSKIDQPNRLVLDVFRMTPSETTSRATPENNAIAPSDQRSSTRTPPVPEKAIESAQTRAKQHAPLRPVRTTESSPQPATRPWRLQYYLAIGLVILMIAILVLALMMLIAKNRWANFNPKIKTDHFLQRQNERIAALDAKIQERLKYFDKE